MFVCVVCADIYGYPKRQEKERWSDLLDLVLQVVVSQPM